MYHIINGGCNTKHASTFSISRPKGLDHYVLLIIKSGGLFHIDSKTTKAMPNSAIIIAPHTPYSYGNPKGDYIDDWLHIDISVPEKSSLIPDSMTNTFIPLPYSDIYTGFIRQLLWENSYTKQPFAKENINALFTVLMNHLQSAYENRENADFANPYKTRLRTLRLEIQNTTNEIHSIKKYADELGVSSSYFQHLYSGCFGISFQKDLIQMRVDHAKYIISSTNLPFEQIAELCGYGNEVHFYRQFKQITGLTPAQYRSGREAF